MIHKGISASKPISNAMVIANQATNFSVGAISCSSWSARKSRNGRAPHGRKQFQNINLAIKYAPKRRRRTQGMALGGGCEIGLHAAKIHSAAEAYIGLVEVVSADPRGGRHERNAFRAMKSGFRRRPRSLPHARPVFRNIATQKWHQREECRTSAITPHGHLFHESRTLVADAKQPRLRSPPAAGNPRLFLAGGRAITQIKCLGESFLAAAKMAIT